MTAVTAIAGWSKPPMSTAPERLIFLSSDRATALASPVLEEVDARGCRHKGSSLPL